MQTKSSQLPDFTPVFIFSMLALWLVFLTLVFMHKAGADEITFQSPIDYWGENHNPKPDSVTLKSKIDKGHPDPSTNKSSFEWDKYINPQNKDFFKEGDYTPPEPFMEIVRNPTDDNLKLWFQYIDKKNKLFQRLEERMQTYSGQGKVALSDDQKSRVIETIKAQSYVSPDATRFRFKFYFDSDCPHCRRMFSTISELQKKGFLVEARQVDNKPISNLPIEFPVERATTQELKAKKITSVPLLLVGDLKEKTVYRITGFQTTKSIFDTISGVSQHF
jgi:thiol-disulfide isomerase/thioredoxin